MILLFALWFFLPGGLANAAPVFAARLPLVRHWDYPLDFHLKVGGQRVFGSHKTIRGVVGGMIVATIVVALQIYAFKHFGWARELSRTVNYNGGAIWWLGPLMGAGALLGDAMESFLKRQIGVAPGQRWFPFDQIDYILGGLIASLAVVRLSLLTYAAVLITWFVMHLLAGYTGYRLQLKERPI